MIKLIKQSQFNIAQYNAVLNKYDLKYIYYTIAHNPCIPALVSKVFNYKPVYYKILSEESVIGYLLGCEIGKKFVSIPHFSYGGPVYTSNKKTNMPIVIRIANYEIRGFEKHNKYYSDEKVSSFLHLQLSPEDQLKKFKYNIRRQIRIASDNLEIRVGKINLLDDFFWVYAKNMQRLGSPPQPKLFFRELLSKYAFGESLVFCAYFNGKCVGGSFYLSYLDVAEVCWSGTDFNYNKLFVSYFLHWQLITHAINKEIKVFSFGRSSKNSGSLRFKQHWGAIEKQLYFNYSERVPSNISLKNIMNNVWPKIIPTRVGIKLGESFSKFLY